MKTPILAMVTVAMLPLMTFAATKPEAHHAKAKSSNALHAYNCKATTTSGEIEQSTSLEKVVFSATKRGALALYLLSYDAGLSDSKKMTITVDSRTDTVKSLSCKPVK